MPKRFKDYIASPKEILTQNVLSTYQNKVLLTVGINIILAVSLNVATGYLGQLPEFEKGDRFKMNLVNCAMIGAFILSMPERPDAERLTVYYANAMMTKPMKWFCRKSGKSKFTEKDIAGMKATAALRAADRNPYSWNMELCVLATGYSSFLFSSQTI